MMLTALFSTTGFKVNRSAPASVMLNVACSAMPVSSSAKPSLAASTAFRVESVPMTEVAFSRIDGPPTAPIASAMCCAVSLTA